MIKILIDKENATNVPSVQQLEQSVLESILQLDDASGYEFMNMNV